MDGCAFSSDGEPGYFGDLHAGARWETPRACSYEMYFLQSFVQTIIASSDSLTMQEFFAQVISGLFSAAH